MGEVRNANKISAGKPDDKRRLGIKRSRWENYIKADLGGMWCGQDICGSG
jgi:hypothetical protein